MYTRRNKNKSILLLLFINFVLSVALINTNVVVAAENSDYQPILYNEDEIKIRSREDLFGFDSLNQQVEYEVFEGEIIVVTKLQAEKMERMKQEAIARQQEIERTTVESSRNVSVDSIDVHTDLSVLRTVNVDDMNKIIDYWSSISRYGTSPFKGQGQIFIDASKQSGLDPIYLLAHAGLESSWGNSDIAKAKNNYFGIGAYDRSPYESSHHMGDKLYDGIINGAVWISNQYYNQGQNTLHTMRYNNGSHEYCTSKTWMYDIQKIMRTSYSLLSS